MKIFRRAAQKDGTENLNILGKEKCERVGRWDPALWLIEHPPQFVHGVHIVAQNLPGEHGDS